MKLLDVFKKRESKALVKSEKAIGSGFRTVGTVMPQGDSFLHFLAIATEEDYPQFIRIRDPYLDSAWVYAAIQVMAQNLAQTPFKILNGDKEIEPRGEYTWLWRLFNNVSPYMNRFALWESVIVWLSMRGECFWRLIRNEVNPQPVRIRVLEPEQMREIIKDGEIAQWEYREPMTAQREMIDPKDIIQFKYYNPYNRFRGMSPLVPASLGLHIDISAAAYNYYFFNNDATPAIILSTEQELDSGEADAIEGRWNKKNRGLKKKGKASVLSRGAKAQQLSLAQKDIEYMAQRKWSREEVFGVLGVPPALAMVLEHASIKSNIREQKKQLFENNLIPKMTMFEDVLRTEFFEREKLGSTLHALFDLEQVDALREDMGEKIKQGILLNKIGFTRNEINKRLELGFEDQPWGNKWWAANTLMPVGDDGSEAAEMQRSRQQGGAQASVAVAVEKDTEYIAMTRMWKSIIRRVDPVEAEFSNELQKYFYALRQEVISNILQRQGYKEIKSIEEELVFNHNQARIRLAEFSIPILNNSYQIGIESLEGLVVNYGLTHPRAVAALGKRVRELDEINVTIAKQLKGEFKPILERGLEEGLAYEKIANELADKTRTVFNNARSRTRTIARTEVNGAMNQARYDMMDEAGTPKHKWVSARDANVRESHQYLDGKVVVRGEEFLPGLKHPHDVGAAPGEVVNCRCITAPVED